MTRSYFLVLMLTVLVSLLGCSSVVPNPKQVSPTSQIAPPPLPVEVALKVDYLSKAMVIQDGLPVVIGQQEFTVRGEVPDALSDTELTQAVRLQGPVKVLQTTVHRSGGKATIEVACAKGQAGDEISLVVDLPGRITGGRTVSLKREADTTVSYSVRYGDSDWHPFTVGEKISKRPFSLRIAFSRGIPQVVGDAAIVGALPNKIVTRWVDPQTFVADFPPLQTPLTIDVNAARSDDGSPILKDSLGLPVISPAITLEPGAG